MATTYKVLGQVAPSATTNTDLYTVGAGKSAVISTIAVCNRASTAATFRIAIRTGGAAISNEDYLAYDSTVAANDTTAFTLGVTLAATDVITVYSSTTTTSFSAFGSEIA
jgi:hypothetical protein